MRIGILRGEGRKQLPANNEGVGSIVFADVCLGVFTVVYICTHTRVNLQWRMYLGC